MSEKLKYRIVFPNHKNHFYNIENKGFIREKSGLLEFKLLEELNINDIELNPDNPSPDFYVIFIPTEVLCDKFFYENFAEDDLRKKDDKKHSYQKKPIIFINFLNLLKDYTIVSENENLLGNEEKIENQNLRNKEFIERTKNFNISKKVNFIDSSIWHYYVPIIKNININNIDNIKEDFKVRLQNAINNIKNNYKLELYNATVSKEFLEFQSRVLKQSYIESIGSNGHADNINPFIFHSETKMRIKADRKFKDLENFFGIVSFKEIEWDILLVDDFSEKQLDGTINNVNSKLEILKSILINNPSQKNKHKFEANQINFYTTGSNNIIFEVFLKVRFKEIYRRVKKNKKIDQFDESNSIHEEYFKVEYINVLKEYGFEVDSIEDEFYKKIFKDNLKEKNNQYDVILLDYLLGEKNINKRELGSEIFTDARFSAMSKHKGPLGKYWIFPITSFSNAMRNEISGEGIQHIHDDWYLFDGADPISTPQLFRYNLFKLMYLQIQQSLITKDDIINFISSYLGDEKIEENKEVGYIIRQQSRRLYGLFMQKFGAVESLKSDAENGSAFAKSILKYTKDNDDQLENQHFFEMVRKTLFLVGYGTHQDVPRIWNLLVEIEDILAKDEKTKMDGFLMSVRDYLNHLKSMD